MTLLMEHPQLSAQQQSLEGRLMQTLAQLQRSQSFLEKISIEQGVAELHVSLYARGVYPASIGGLLGATSKAPARNYS